MYELIIIGGGPAGISAGIYAARKKLKVLLIAQDWGGQISGTAIIENYPGFELISGPDLVKRLMDHLEKVKEYGLKIQKGNLVQEVSFIENNSVIEVRANGQIYQTKTVIVASGRYPKKLNIPGEEKFLNKGVSYCTTCDGPLFKDKPVAVIGGGNAGLEAALDLASYANKVYLLEFLPQLTADQCFQERAVKNNKINILTDKLVKEIKGDQLVDSLIYQERKSNELKEIAVEGVFIEIGSIANSSFVKNVVELNKEGEIKIDSKNKTSQPNIFAAGGVTDISHKQIVIAAGEGAKAALNAYDYLINLK